MIVVDDVVKLYDLDLENNYIAAVPDLIMKSFVNKSVKTPKKLGRQVAAKYLSDIIGVTSENGPYFQAGTLVLDLERMRKSDLSTAMIADIQKNHYWFLDQDVLNKHLRGKVKLLDYKWNSVFIPDDHLAVLSEADNLIYKSSRENANIFHYAGIEKPWQKAQASAARYYWNYLRDTPWYEQTLLGLVAKKEPLSLQLPPQNSLRLAARIIWSRMPRFSRVLLRPVLKPIVWIARKFR